MDFLFDIGNVILEVDFHTSLRRILPAGADANAVIGRLLVRKDELESGRMEDAEFLDWAVASVGGGVTRDEFVAAWLDIFRPVRAMWRTIAALAGAGHRLILFSNTNELHASSAFGRYPVFGSFAGAVYSHRVGVMKPHEEIYRHAVENFGLVPERTIYVDDLPENVATGRRLGFRCWQYDAAGHAEFEAWLDGEMRALAAGG